MSCPNVTAADQQQINRFARLHQNYTQMKDEIKELENELQNINEAADELLLLDSEDAASVPLRIGQTFIHFDSDTMMEKLDKFKEEAEEKLVDLKEQNSSIEKEMDCLKGSLYAKFGDRINLETEKDD